MKHPVRLIPRLQESARMQSRGVVLIFALKKGMQKMSGTLDVGSSVCSRWVFPIRDRHNVRKTRLLCCFERLIVPFSAELSSGVYESPKDMFIYDLPRNLLKAIFTGPFFWLL
jgi:hypothetical protein